MIQAQRDSICTMSRTGDSLSREYPSTSLVRCSIGDLHGDVDVLSEMSIVIDRRLNTLPLRLIYCREHLILDRRLNTLPLRLIYCREHLISAYCAQEVAVLSFGLIKSQVRYWTPVSLLQIARHHTKAL